MKVIDPGHQYLLLSLDGVLHQELIFVKRCNDLNPGQYPGNTESHAGTNMQSVLRALLERMRYLENQIPCYENTIIISLLRSCLWLLELRAARRHKRMYYHLPAFAESEPLCPRCGHTDCGCRKP